MTQLTIHLNLSAFPEYHTVPNEPATVLRELADWIEKKDGEYENVIGNRKVLRNFESVPCGTAIIERI